MGAMGGSSSVSQTLGSSCVLAPLFWLYDGGDSAPALAGVNVLRGREQEIQPMQSLTDKKLSGCESQV